MIKITTNKKYLQYSLIDKPKLCRLESSHQMDVFSLIRKHFPEAAKLTFHATNEGMHKAWYREKQIKEGMLTGAADIISLYSGKNNKVFVCELKQPKKTHCSLRKEQIDFLNESADQGHFACVAFGSTAAWYAWLDYVGVDKNDTLRDLANHMTS